MGKHTIVCTILVLLVSLHHITAVDIDMTETSTVGWHLSGVYETYQHAVAANTAASQSRLEADFVPGQRHVIDGGDAALSDVSLVWTTALEAGANASYVQAWAVVAVTIGPVVVDDDLAITSLVVRGGSSDSGNGGLLRCVACSLSINDAILSGSTGGVFTGGVIDARQGGDISIVDSGIYDGRAAFGGAIFAHGCSVSLERVTFGGNSAGVSGGSIYHDGGEFGAMLSLTDVTFTDSSALAYGSAVTARGTLVMDRITFEDSQERTFLQLASEHAAVHVEDPEDSAQAASCRVGGGYPTKDTINAAIVEDSAFCVFAGDVSQVSCPVGQYAASDGSGPCVSCFPLPTDAIWSTVDVTSPCQWHCPSGLTATSTGCFVIGGSGSGPCSVGQYALATCGDAEDVTCVPCPHKPDFSVFVSNDDESCTWECVDPYVLHSSGAGCVIECANGEFYTGSRCETCSPECTAGFYTALDCVGSHDRACVPCSIPENAAFTDSGAECEWACIPPYVSDGAEGCMLECSAGSFLSGDVCTQCSDACEVGYYETSACTATSDRSCIACFLPAFAEAVADSNPCAFACISPYVLDSTNTICVLDCPDNEYFDGTGCVSCGPPCDVGEYDIAHCGDATPRMCLACPSPPAFASHVVSDDCQWECVAGFYGSVAGVKLQRVLCVCDWRGRDICVYAHRRYRLYTVP